MQMKIFAQGDLLIERVDDIPPSGEKFVPTPDGAMVLAEGEVTSRRRREEERAAALQAVQDLKLQSVLFGNRRAAMLNNQMVAEGQTIEGFIVEKITADGVIVRMGVYRFELKMKK